MTATNEQKSETANRELAITRVFNAPPKLVFEAWTDPDHLIHWWGPVGFTNTNIETDIRSGGLWRFTMHGPDGTDYPNRIDFIEVNPFTSMTYVHSDDGGELSFEVSVTFEEEGENTRLTMKTVFPSAEFLEMAVRQNGADRGMTEHLNNLEDHLTFMDMNANVDEIFTISRVFDAPINLVYQAWTQPEHLAKWWGPAGFDISIARFELEPGGMFLYSMQPPNANIMWGRFLYSEIIPKVKLVYTNSFADENGNPTRNPWMPEWPLEVLNILTFSDYGNQTAINLKGLPVNSTKAERDNYVAAKSSMHGGFKGTMDQLASFLETLK